MIKQQQEAQVGWSSRCKGDGVENEVKVFKDCQQ
jgi:hypothetical protein